MNFKSAISQKLVLPETILLPIDITKSATLPMEGDQAGLPYARDMIFEPDPEHMIEELPRPTFFCASVSLHG